MCGSLNHASIYPSHFSDIILLINWKDQLHIALTVQVYYIWRSRTWQISLLPIKWVHQRTNLYFKVPTITDVTLKDCLFVFLFYQGSLFENLFDLHYISFPLANSSIYIVLIQSYCLFKREPCIFITWGEFKYLYFFIFIMSLLF